MTTADVKTDTMPMRVDGGDYSKDRRFSGRSFFRPREKKSYGHISDSILHYVVAWVVLSLYGGKACPFVDGISFYSTTVALGIGIGVAYLFRLVLFLVYKRLFLHSSSKVYLFIETMFFVVWAGIGLAWGILFEGFHIEGIIKVALGAIIPGFFFSLEMLNARERHMIYLGRKEKKYILYRNKYFSLRKKILLFGIAAIGLVGITISLTTYKNFVWTLANVGVYSNQEILLSVAKETLFVIGIFFGLIIKLIISYSQNISLYFLIITSTLDSIAAEKYTERIPITSYDEFAVLANHVNSISSELEEKKKIKSIFGKIMNPVIAQKLMSERSISRQGFEDELVVLFSDIRGFTTISENKKPNEVVDLLNRYFTATVAVIKRNGGVVDKFMGDGIMAVFGIENKEGAALAATKAALEMQIVVKNDFSEFSIGIGIHTGLVTAGLIGSPERMEFTIIGDTVNTASRLESATKEVKMGIIISEGIYKNIESTYTMFKNIGKLHLKGKGVLLNCYGLAV